MCSATETTKHIISEISSCISRIRESFTMENKNQWSQQVTKDFEELEKMGQKISENNYVTAMLLMFDLACHYNMVKFKVCATKKSQLVQFITKSIPQAYSQVLQQVEWYQSVFGINVKNFSFEKGNEVTLLQQNIIVVANLHEPLGKNAPSSFPLLGNTINNEKKVDAADGSSLFNNLVTIENLPDFEHVRNILTEANSVALQELTELFLTSSTSESNSNQLDEAVNLYEKASVVPHFATNDHKSPTFESSLRKFRITRLNNGNNSIVEHVQLSVPWEKFNKHEFIIKTFPDLTKKRRAKK